METKLLSFGNDVLWDKVISLQNRALVGRWHSFETKDLDMVGCVTAQWTSFLGYTPKLSKLINHWFSFHFLQWEDAECILSWPWVFG